MIGEDYRRSFQLKTGHPPGKLRDLTNVDFRSSASCFNPSRMRDAWKRISDRVRIPARPRPQERMGGASGADRAT